MLSMSVSSDVPLLHSMTVRRVSGSRAAPSSSVISTSSVVEPAGACSLPLPLMALRLASSSCSTVATSECSVWTLVAGKQESTQVSERSDPESDRRRAPGRTHKRRAPSGWTRTACEARRPGSSRTPSRRAALMTASSDA